MKAKAISLRLRASAAKIVFLHSFASRGSVQRKAKREPRWWRDQNHARSIVLISTLPGFEKHFFFFFPHGGQPWDGVCPTPGHGLNDDVRYAGWRVPPDLT
jgi:hypothetical protein